MPNEQPDGVQDWFGYVGFGVTDVHVDLHGVECVVVQIRDVIERNARRLRFDVVPILRCCQRLRVACRVFVRHGRNRIHRANRKARVVEMVNIAHGRNVAQARIAIVFNLRNGRAPKARY